MKLMVENIASIPEQLFHCLNYRTSSKLVQEQHHAALYWPSMTITSSVSLG